MRKVLAALIVMVSGGVAHSAYVPPAGNPVSSSTVTPTGGTSAQTLANSLPLSITNFGAISSSDAPSCTTTASSTSMTCTGAISSFAAGQHITMQINGVAGPGPASSLSQPSIAVAATTLDASVFLPTAGCHVTASVGSISASSNSLSVDNTRLYLVGDTITVAGAGAAGAALTTTVSSVSVGGVSLTLAANASTTVAQAAVTGFNCTTTWRYQVAAVDALGGKSQASSIVQITNGASELTPSNFNEITLNTVSGSVAYLLYACKGASCTPTLAGIEIPNQTYNAGADPLLLTFSGRSTPTTITFHDWGMWYGQDSYGGTTAPGAQTKQQLDTTIVSISGSTVVLAVAPTNSGTFVMRHDNGPAFSAALQAECNANYAVYLTPGHYDIGSTVSNGGTNCFAATFQGPASGFSEANNYTTDFNWVGPIGGTALNMSGMPGALIGGFIITAGENSMGGATPGVGVDYDQVGSPSATETVLRGISVTNAGIAVRFCNTGANCDSMTVDQFAAVGYGFGYGIYNNSRTSLAFDLEHFDIAANIGVFSTTSGGNMNLSHGLLGDGPSSVWVANYYGGIGFWMRSFPVVSIRFQDVHAEFVTKFFYEGGDNREGLMTCDNCRISPMLDWDGYAIRMGQGQAVIVSSIINGGGTTQGSAVPSIFLESGFSAIDLGGNTFVSYPNLVGGGGTSVGLGSTYLTQVGASQGDVTSNLNVQLGLPAAATSAIGGSSLAAGACTSGTATVTGATTAMSVAVAPVATPLASSSAGLSVFGYVSAANTVTVDVCAIVATTPISRVYNVRVLQ